MSQRLMGRLLGAICIAGSLGFAAQAAPIEGPTQPNVCGAGGQTLAATCLFVAVGGTPRSARTDFIEDWDTQGYDGETLATHELLHAVGFTVNYANFANNLFATPGAGAGGIPAASRVYSTTGTAAGIRLVLTPSADGTHADPAATGAGPWPATGYNQSGDIMQPELPLNTVRGISAEVRAVLEHAFGWNNTGITINVINLGNSHSDVDMGLINNAVAAINALWPSQANSPVFTWTVAEVPEPAALWLLLVGGTALLLVARPAPRAGAAIA